MDTLWWLIFISGPRTNTNISPPFIYICQFFHRFASCAFLNIAPPSKCSKSDWAEISRFYKPLGKKFWARDHMSWISLTGASFDVWGKAINIAGWESWFIVIFTSSWRRPDPPLSCPCQTRSKTENVMIMISINIFCIIMINLLRDTFVSSNSNWYLIFILTQFKTLIYLPSASPCRWKHLPRSTKDPWGGQVPWNQRCTEEF